MSESAPSTSSGGKSKEEIAFEILSKLKGVGVWGENNKAAILDMYAECLVATNGKRVFGTAAPQAQPQPAIAPQAPVQAQPAVQTQPVHAQQQLQQAFKQS